MCRVFRSSVMGSWRTLFPRYHFIVTLSQKTKCLWKRTSSLKNFLLPHVCMYSFMPKLSMHSCIIYHSSSYVFWTNLFPMFWSLYIIPRWFIQLVKLFPVWLQNCMMLRKELQVCYFLSSRSAWLYVYDGILYVHESVLLDKLMLISPFWQKLTELLAGDDIKLPFIYYLKDKFRIS